MLTQVQRAIQNYLRSGDAFSSTFTVQSSSPRFPIGTPTARAPRKIGIAIDLSDENAYTSPTGYSKLSPIRRRVLLHVQPTSVFYDADWGDIDLSRQRDPDNEESQRKMEDDFDIFTNKKASDVSQPLVKAEIPFKIHIVKDQDMKKGCVWRWRGKG